jgi:hypothetical protein
MICGIHGDDRCLFWEQNEPQKYPLLGKRSYLTLKHALRIVTTVIQSNESAMDIDYFCSATPVTIA